MYYQGSSEIQGDGLQTLYLMNPNFTGGYSEAQQQPGQQPTANMVILNYAATAAGNPMNFPGIATGQQQAQTQHLVGVPLHQTAGANIGSSSNNNNSNNDLKLINHLSMDSSQHELPSPASRPQPGSSTVIPHFHHGLWGSLDHAGVSTGGGSPSSHHQHIPSGVVISNNNPVDVGGTRLGFHRPTQQGLSLTLSSSQQQHAYHHHRQQQQQHQSVSVVNTPIGILSPRNTTGLSGSPSSVSNGLPPGGFQSTVFGSKYLKAAQELLDELVNVGKADIEKGKEKGKVQKELSAGLTTVETSQQIGQTDSKSTPTTELTVAQRQELQMKKAKLVSMLDEVEQRYRQYHHQMQIVVASFEQAAGIGSAKSYTQLALQTISKQFRCLKDAISSQIKAACKSLGEDHESLGGRKLEGGSRLKFVDQQLRQQRALQQLGMMQNNTWRPQRGLPERAVSVLRAWLFEHFLHPYPKDSDKQMLAKQTGLTRSQVSNWFINARVRLWKPMVEEMYLEETKNQDQDGSDANKEVGSNSKNPKENDNAARMDQRNAPNQQEKPLGNDSSDLALPSPSNTSPQARTGNFGLLEALNIQGSAEKNAKRMRSVDQPMQNSPSSILSVEMDMKFGDARKGSSFNGGFGTFGLGELGQFNPGQLPPTGFHGNSVSLTLGLPPSDHQNLPLSAAGNHQQNFLSEQMEGHYDQRVNNKSQQPSSHPDMGYETINFGSRKRFAAQLLPDFVT